MCLLIATCTVGLSRKCQSSLLQCYIHHLHTITSSQYCLATCMVSKLTSVWWKITWSLRDSPSASVAGYVATPHSPHHFAHAVERNKPATNQQRIKEVSHISNRPAVPSSDNSTGCISKVTLHPAWLVLRWWPFVGIPYWVCNWPLGQLSLCPQLDGKQILERGSGCAV